MLLSDRKSGAGRILFFCAAPCPDAFAEAAVVSELLPEDDPVGMLFMDSFYWRTEIVL